MALTDATDSAAHARACNRYYRKASVLVAALLSVASAAGAGPRYSEGGEGVVKIVRYNDGSGYVDGALGVVRNSASKNESIGCSIERAETLDDQDRPVARTIRVICEAKDASKQKARCVSDNERLAEAFEGISDDAIITFRFDANNQCTGVTIYQSSSLDRKQ